MDYWPTQTEAHSLASSFLIGTQSPHIPKVLQSHSKYFRIARMEVRGLLTYKITSSPYNVIFSHFPRIWEFVLIISVNIAVHITNNSKDRGYPCLIALFNPVSSHVYPWTQTLHWNLTYMALIQFMKSEWKPMYKYIPWIKPVHSIKCFFLHLN